MLWMLLSRANALAACPSGDCIHSESAFALTNPERWPIAYAPYTRVPVAGIAIANAPMMANIILRRSSWLAKTLPDSTARFAISRDVFATDSTRLACTARSLARAEDSSANLWSLGVHGFDL